MITVEKFTKCGKKGVAIPYIIALILGIAVIAVLGYWFFVLGGKLGGIGVTTECRAKEVSYCQAWETLGYGDTKPLEPDWGTCKAIKDYSDPEGRCKNILG